MNAPDTIVRILVTGGLAVACWLLLRWRHSAHQTTLLSAWRWGLAGLFLWLATWILDRDLGVVSKPVADHLWYFCAVLALCPPMAVLGSRRPGARVWTLFIQFPMLLVLGWPIITLATQSQEVRGLQLETPQLIAYLLVLIMGVGNYVGTRLTFSAVFYAAALGSIAISSSTAAPSFLTDRATARLAGTCLLVLAIWNADRVSRQAARTTDKFDRLWFDFFDQFGVVWGRRIQDRINHVAKLENWPGRLELSGFEWTSTPDDRINSRLEHTWRWLLRRFVDPAWIDQRLGQTTSEKDVTAMSTDS